YQSFLPNDRMWLPQPHLQHCHQQADELRSFLFPFSISSQQPTSTKDVRRTFKPSKLSYEKSNPIKLINYKISK
ncbi:MAG: hypothetical protein ACTSSN_06110, partial [Candidatus Heimdallarchaeaceae archaeon]